MSQGNVYALFLLLPKEKTLCIGALGEYTFFSGLYIYCGSAQKNLKARLGRHKQREKSLRWHVDYLSVHCTYVGELVKRGPKKGECALADAFGDLPYASFPIPRFGSSDCSCFSHLVYLPWKVLALP